MPRIQSLEIRGFRAFGATPQSLDFRGPIALLWGANSQGKTSLAEAIEFLLTGRTTRRQFVASANREFSDSLRNAHLPAAATVCVTATIVDRSGRARAVSRSLRSDYTAQSECSSDLTIDGAPADDLSSLGIALSQPPLEAPILMQHSLRYVVSAKPQDRSDYFKALLELADLEALRTAIADSKPAIPTTVSPVLETLRSCCGHALLNPALQALPRSAPTKAGVLAALGAALDAILQGPDPIPSSLENRLALVRRNLSDRREATFPLQGFTPGPAATWTQPDDAIWGPLDGLAALTAGIDKEAARLSSLFAALLEVPSVAAATTAIDCPICETRRALSSERIAAIRKHLADTEAFLTAQGNARKALLRLGSFAQGIARSVLAARPPFLTWDTEERSRRSFTEQAMRQLLASSADDLLQPWSASIPTVERTVAATGVASQALETAIAAVDLDSLAPASVASLKQLANTLVTAGDDATRAIRALSGSQAPLVRALQAEVDRRSRVEGWQELVELADHRDELLEDLVEDHARKKVASDLDEAVRQIDRAKGGVLDSKFGDLSSEIIHWWALLRPCEPTTFTGLQRAGTGRRYIDLKAGLSSLPDGSSPSALRDVVAVFSDSQLNCLGLSAFLARAIREQTGFVVLDDPVPASDDEHRAMFIHRVLEELVTQSYQIILLTHDQNTWKDTQERYKHLDIDAFILTLENPAQGSLIKNTSDTLPALLACARPYISNADPVIRKEFGARRLREASERLCKELLVSHRRSRGDTSAALSDYDGKTLGDLQPLIDPLLTADASHPGKLRTITRHLNPGSHDALVPTAGELAVCLGDLDVLRRQYL